jgi:hypothetical protein
LVFAEKFCIKVLGGFSKSEKRRQKEGPTGSKNYVCVWRRRRCPVGGLLPSSRDKKKSRRIAVVEPTM